MKHRLMLSALLVAGILLPGCGQAAEPPAAAAPTETALAAETVPGQAAETESPMTEKPPAESPEAVAQNPPSQPETPSVPAQPDAPVSPETPPPPEVTETPDIGETLAAVGPPAAPPPTDARREYTGPDLSEQPRMDDWFFAGSAFFGNSLIRGLKMYGGIDTTGFFGVNSAAVYNVGMTLNCQLSDGTPCTLLDALGEWQFGRVYILLGINEISFDVDYFITQYSGILDEIQAREPLADIYIMSLTPITEEKSEDETVFTKEKVLDYNAALHQLAAERQCYYVDLVEALADPDGYLPADHSTDGVHLTQDYYPLWGEYLRTHYAPEAD